MAKTLRSVQFFAIFVVFILFASSEMMMVEALCNERPSQTWSGNCGNTAHCDKQCQEWEKASHGACHKRENHWKCFCYFNCKQKHDNDHHDHDHDQKKV